MADDVAALRDFADKRDDKSAERVDLFVVASKAQSGDRRKLVELDARLRSRRATNASMGSLSWARFASFDRCDGYSISDTPFVRPMNLGEFAQFRRRR